MSEKFIIQNNGKKPKGTIEVKGAKNVALPVLAATLLTEKECIIRNLPLIEDILRMIKILEDLGAEISWLEKDTIKIKCLNIDPSKLPPDIVARFRGSILVLGPLLARFGKVILPPPGGCIIGARPLDTHLDSFSQMGVKISTEGRFYHFEKNNNFKPKDQDVLTVSKKDNKDIFEVIFREFSVTAAENMLLFSALNCQKSILKIADVDYQIQELIKVVNKMGAKANMSGIHTISIEGAKKLNGFDYTIISDPIETGTFIVLSLATKGEVIIKKAQLSFIELFLKRLRDFGAKFEILGSDSIKIMPSENMKMDKIQSLPYPGIHTDLQPELGVLATQTKGPTLIHDPLYESRLRYLEELNKMGADIIFCDPHRAIVIGPTELTGIKIPSPDLRAGAALVIAGLIAKGTTTIENIYQIDRGYERIEERFQKLGLDIKRVNS